MSFEIPGADIIVFRGSSGEARALGAHCPHMGTHLGKGCVIGDQVRCPMHHWRYDGDGNCHKHESATAAVSDFKLTAYPLAESYGAIFVFNATEALFPPPEFESGGTNDIATRAGKPVFLDCPWEAVAANGFDRQHFETVHERALRNEPELTRPTPYLLRLHYTSRVTGRTIVDRTMKWLSRDHINVRITCWGGTNVLVESDLGRTRSALILCLVPTKEATTVTPLFGVYQSRFHWIDKLRLNLAAWLFGGFLRRDVAIMNGMRFHPRATREEDPILYRYLEYIRSLPRVSADFHSFEPAANTSEAKKEKTDEDIPHVQSDDVNGMHALHGRSSFPATGVGRTTRSRS